MNHAKRFFLLLLFLFGGIIFLLATEPGFQLLLRSVDTLAGPVFSVEEVQGHFFDRWQVNQVRLDFGDAVKVELDEFAFSWNPKALLKRKLHLRQIRVQGLKIHLADSDLKKSEKKAATHPVVLPKILLPFDLILDDLLLHDGRISFSPDSAPLIINAFMLQAAAHDKHVTIKRIKLDSPDYGVDLQGKVELSKAWPLELHGNWRLTDPGINDLAGSLEATGNMDKLEIALSLATPAEVTLKGELTNILNVEKLHWRAAAETGHFQLSDIKVDVPVDGTLTIVEAAGTLGSYSGTLAADIHYAGYPRIQAEAKITAEDYFGLNVEYLTVRHAAASLTARGVMDWSDGFSWDAELEGEQVDPALFLPEWPGKISGLVHSEGALTAAGTSLQVRMDGLQGELTGIPFALNGGMRLEKGELSIDALHMQSGSAEVRINGQAAADGTINCIVQADAEDLAEFMPKYSGAVHLRGTVSGSRDTPNLQLSLNGSELQIQDYSLTSLEADLTAALDLEKKNILIQDFGLLLADKAHLQAKGRVGWADGLSWQSDLKGEQLDPSLFLPDWPGAVDVRLRTQGKRSKNGRLAARIDIEQLQGEVRNFPLVGSGKVELIGKNIIADNLNLQSGSTYLQVDGRADWEQRLDLSFKAGSEKLARLLPDIGGSFKLEGAISGTPKQPKLNLSINAAKLRMRDYSLNELKGTIKADLASSGEIDAAIEATGIRIKEEKISRAQIQVQGSKEEHQLRFSAAGNRGKVELTAVGGLKEEQWQGNLSRLLLFNKQFGSWKTAQPADLLLSSNNCALSGFALVQDQMRVAVNGTWDTQDGWQTDSTVDDLSLDRLKQWNLPVPPQLDGILSLSLKADGQGAIPERTDLTLSLPDLALTAEDYEKDDGSMATWHWKNNQVRGKLKNNTVQLTAQTRFQDGSTADLKVNLSTNGNFSSKPDRIPIDGSLNVNILDLGPVAPLTDYMVQATGGFGGRIALGGTVADPTLNGRLALKKGGKNVDKELHIPAAGISIRELELSFEGDTRSNRMLVQLASGEGRLKAKGEINRKAEQSMTADFTIHGKNFEAVDLPEYQAVISPELHLLYGPSGTKITGNVTVPKAEITPAGFSGSVSPSQDVVIVDVDKKGESAQNTLPMSLDISLILGEEVTVDAFGVKGFLDGSLHVQADPGQAVTGKGSIALRDGTVDFKGTSLKLNESRVFYQGGPLDNPGLDIRASREINDVEAGIHLTGSAGDMEMRLFSDTPMNDSEILSWLLTGEGASGGTAVEPLSPAAAALSKMGGGALLKSVNPLGAVGMENFLDLNIGGGKEASDVSLIMGKEIYKNLYISYGKGLAGADGAFKARYDLGLGFSVESETTSKTTGADLFWSLER